MLACRSLGYLADGPSILDPTYGRGVWWKLWRPSGLVQHDLMLDGFDFTSMPLEDESVDDAVFDPPYAPQGGVETSTLRDYNTRYGRELAPKTPDGIQKLSAAGLAELRRVVRRPRRERGELVGGHVLVKCMDYIWSGSLHLATLDVADAARALGFTIEDKLEHVGKASRPQPGGRSRKCPECKGTPRLSDGTCPTCAGEGRVATVQEHARRNVSTLFVLRIPKQAQARRLL